MKLGIVPPPRHRQTRRYQQYLNQLMLFLDGTIDSARYAWRYDLLKIAFDIVVVVVVVAVIVVVVVPKNH